MTVDVTVLTGPALDAALDDVARLRIAVFRDWPYLYDGDLDYEQKYLQLYRKSDHSVLVGAFDGNRLIGAATGTPMEDHASDFSDAFKQIEVDLNDIFYFAESVLLPEYRGKGIGHRFFDLREEQAQKMERGYAAFCGVVRPLNHPLRPMDYAPLDPFWRKRGYAPLDGVVAQFSWKDIDQQEETAKPLQFWMRCLSGGRS